MHAHRSQVSGDQDPIVFGGYAQDLRIESAVWNRARRGSKIDRRFPSEQAFPNVRIDIGAGLKTDAQASLVGASFFARSKRSIMS